MIVYEELKKKINNETYAPGQFLPSETELQQIYNVSRITVRRALADLEHDYWVLVKMQNKMVRKLLLSF